MSEAREPLANRVASGGLKRDMRQRLSGIFKLTVGATLFAGIAALSIWRLLG
jgi:hypothetical protein